MHVSCFQLVDAHTIIVWSYKRRKSEIAKQRLILIR